MCTPNARARFTPLLPNRDFRSLKNNGLAGGTGCERKSRKKVVLRRDRVQIDEKIRILSEASILIEYEKKYLKIKDVINLFY